MSNSKEKQFTLSKSSPLKEFDLKYSFVTLVITRIIFTSRLGLEFKEWSKGLEKITILFKSFMTETKSESSFIFSLISRITPNHRNPIFDVSIEVPEENIGQISSLVPFFNKVIISIKDPFQFEEGFTLTFYYHDKPGLEG